ncbi:hypothetical protein [Spiroplasma attinicola]|uniref:hypothetical protein n=1 Tax=Spiroplasma attinicola TaxID=2904537 RepID=UPI002022B33D|nr:hypothetical protein [Spiroplasma sp. JKS002670]MCL8209999.1 hypothetical protein [Spiroplasma sp. JKS002670]
MVKKTNILEYDKGIISLETDSFKIIKFNKDNFKFCVEIMETFLNLSGIYFLSRINENSEREIYIGQTSNGFLNRIQANNHKWNEYKDFDLVVWITLLNGINPWTKNELDYIEQYFIKLFSVDDEMILINKSNGNKNNGIPLNSEKQFLINEQIKTIKDKLIMIVGDKLFYETSNFEQIKNFNTNLTDNMFLEIYAKDNKKNLTEAILNIETNSVMLKKGTIIKTGNLSNKVINELNIDGEKKMQKDTWFNSPTKAALLISGYKAVNGWDYWKIKDSKKQIKELRNNN